MQYCSKCGRPLVEDAKFCHGCGTPTRAGEKTQEFTVSAEDLSRKLEEIIHEGNVSRIIVKDEKGSALLDIPVTLGVVGAVLAPWLAALGVIAALATKCTLVVERGS